MGCAADDDSVGTTADVRDPNMGRTIRSQGMALAQQQGCATRRSPEARWRTRMSGGSNAGSEYTRLHVTWSRLCGSRRFGCHRTTVVVGGETHWTSRPAWCKRARSR